jgi:hypothetical protein
MVFGSIFQSWRNFFSKISPNFFGKLFSCPMCLSTWVGALLSTVLSLFGYSTPFTEYGITSLPLIIFFDSCFSSGCVWIIHNIEEMTERIGQK